MGIYSLHFLRLTGGKDFDIDTTALFFGFLILMGFFDLVFFFGFLLCVLFVHNQIGKYRWRRFSFTTQARDWCGVWRVGGGCEGSLHCESGREGWKSVP